MLAPQLVLTGKWAAGLLDELLTAIQRHDSDGFIPQEDILALPASGHQRR